MKEIAVRPQLTKAEIASGTAISVRTVERAFQNLKKSGRIIRVGGRRFGQWQIVRDR